MVGRGEQSFLVRFEAVAPSMVEACCFRLEVGVGVGVGKGFWNEGSICGCTKEPLGL